MIALVQVISAGIGIALFFFAFRHDPPPGIVYVPVIALSMWLGVKLYARLRYGKGTKVTPSPPE